MLGTQVGGKKCRNVIKKHVVKWLFVFEIAPV